MPPSPIRSSGVRLQLSDYKVVPMKPELACFVFELGQAVAEGISAQSDVNRRDFYDVYLRCGHLYIHIYARTRTVYLMARFSSEACADRYEDPESEVCRSMAAAV